MSEKELIKQLKRLPSEAQQEAADFVELLYKKYIGKVGARSESKKSILESSFRGVWKNRKDMQDSAEWVRNIRKSRWAN